MSDYPKQYAAEFEGVDIAEVALKSGIVQDWDDADELDAFSDFD